MAWQEVDGEAILLDLEATMYLGLNGSATVLWPEMASGTTREDLVALLRNVSESRTIRQRRTSTNSSPSLHRTEPSSDEDRPSDSR